MLDALLAICAASALLASFWCVLMVGYRAGYDDALARAVQSIKEAADGEA